MFKFFAVVFVIVLVILIPPFVGIWALNTLFSLNIVVNFNTWLAMFVLMLIFGNGSRK
jgi:hypothetical protein